MSYRCSGCGQSGIAPGVCDRCSFEYVPDEPGATAGGPRQIHRRPWKHFESANAFTAFTGLSIQSRWFDWLSTALRYAFYLAMWLLPFPLLALAPEAVAGALGGALIILGVAWISISPAIAVALWELLAQPIGRRAYEALASIGMNERAIRLASKVVAARDAAEGPCVLIGETSAIETVSRPDSGPVLAYQDVRSALTLQDVNLNVQYDVSGHQLIPSIGGDFSLTDESGASIVIRAEHVVIESPRLDLSVPVGSRVAASGNVVWVAGEEGYRGGHGHWEMVGTWDQPIILRVLRAGPDPAAGPTGIRVAEAEAPGEESAGASEVADDDAVEASIERHDGAARRG